MRNYKFLSSSKNDQCHKLAIPKGKDYIWEGLQMNRQNFIKSLVALGTGVNFLGFSNLFAKTPTIKSNSNKNKVVLFSLGGGIRIQDLKFMTGFFNTNLNANEIDLNADLKKSLHFSEIVTEHKDHIRNWKDVFVTPFNRTGLQLFEILNLHKKIKSEELFFLESNSIPKQSKCAVHNHTFMQFRDDISALRKTQDLINMNDFRFITTRLNSFDVCHHNYSEYLKNLTSVSELIYEIISTDKNKDNTHYLVVSEMGRNLLPNQIVDSNGNFGFDHFDENSRRAWVLYTFHFNKNTESISRFNLNSIKVLKDIPKAILGFF